MSNNDPANDRYNPPSTYSADFESMNFDDLPEHELFWLKNTTGDNQVYRKVNETEGMNLNTREIFTFKNKEKVFQKI